MAGWCDTTTCLHIARASLFGSFSTLPILMKRILMDGLLDFPPVFLESVTHSQTASCLAITSTVQLAGVVVWIGHQRGLGMPRHKKTRLLHWPAYRLLFLIQVLDWRPVGVDAFFKFKACPRIVPLTWEHFASVDELVADVKDSAFKKHKAVTFSSSALFFIHTFLFKPHHISHCLLPKQLRLCAHPSPIWGPIRLRGSVTIWVFSQHQSTK